jgi:ubiquinone/menaquinone biosynthesis C-methylase UbiE
VSADTPGALSPALIDALMNPRAPEFCRVLRRLYYEELNAGSVDAIVPPAEAASLALAVTLDLLRPGPRPNSLRFTPLGYEIGNVAKEYANWLDAGRALPDGVEPSLVQGRRVLDVGCGFGRHALGFSMAGGRVTGIDFQHNYLRLSSAFAAQLQLAPPAVARARAESLPFRTDTFDVVFCRLVINYVAITRTLDEFARVLAPGGILVLVVDPLTMPLQTLAASNWWRNKRTVAFALFGLLNTMVLQTTGRQLTIRTRGRMHAQHSPAWPTAGWFSRRLRRHGFAPISGTGFRDPRRPGVFTARIPAS